MECNGEDQSFSIQLKPSGNRSGLDKTFYDEISNAKFYRGSSRTIKLFNLDKNHYIQFILKDSTIKHITMKPTEHKQEILDKRYMRMALIWAENSYCQRRQVGALIVKDKMIISDGYNGTPAGFENVCEDENGEPAPMCFMPKPTPSPR